VADVPDLQREMNSYTRLLLPIGLIVVGIVISLSGAAFLWRDTKTQVRVSDAGADTRVTTTETTGSPWGYLCIGVVVLLSGCVLQVISWRGQPSLAMKSSLRVPAAGKFTAEEGGGAATLAPGPG
jgi:hypothetical protein